jgi:L-histidine N-alpha-methyltransferase
VPTVAVVADPIAQAALEGLLASPKTLSPWLFYDERGSQLFEDITRLPEYYLTRTERAILAANADAIIQSLGGPVTIAELGAGTATKTGLLLSAAVRHQRQVVYQPIDVSPTALDEAARLIEKEHPGVTVRPQVANYITDPICIARPRGTRILALYIGSSIGNFSPIEAHGILKNLRSQLQAGDALLIGTDLAPSPNKSETALIAAYDDAEGVTAAFNLNVLARLNRDIGTNFDLACFRHQARWNPVHSRMEMHLVAEIAHTVHISADGSNPAQTVTFQEGETIHTENSHKFTSASIDAMLTPAGFTPTQTFHDPDHLFSVTLAAAV